MKLVTLAGGRLRYVLPFPPLARALGVCLLVLGPLMFVAALLARLPTGGLLALAATTMLDLVLGLVLFGGYRYIEADRMGRRLVTGHAALGVGLPFATRERQLAPDARLVIGTRSAGSDTIHDVDFVQADGRQRLISFATADNAERFAQALSVALEIDGDVPPT